MNAGLLLYVGGGRIATSLAVPSIYAPGAVGCTGITVAVEEDAAVMSWVAGLPRGKNGHICVNITALPIVGYVAGLPISNNGTLACDTSGTIVSYVRGLPITAAGRVAIATPV